MRLTTAAGTAGPARIAVALAAAGGLVLGAAGCQGSPKLARGAKPSASPSRSPGPSPSPSPSPSPTPAEAAGGTCALLNYDAARTALGTSFQAAAANADGSVQTCALQVLGAEYPDLVVTVAATKADAKTFGRAAPDDSDSVSGLGQAAYRRTIAAQPAQGNQPATGPVDEVSWLGKQSKVVTVRYTFPVGAASGDAGTMLGKLVAYCKTLEAKR